MTTRPAQALLHRWRARVSPRHRRSRLGPRYPTSVHVRRALAAVLFCLAAVLALRPSSAAEQARAPVLVADRDLATGSTVRAEDLRMARFPRHLAPRGALITVDAAVGAVLASAARAGEPITEARLIGKGRAGLDADHSAVPIRLADAGVADLLHPGAKVDVVTVDPGSAHTPSQGKRVVASSATVVTITSPRGGETAALQGPLVLISVPSSLATHVAAMSLNQPVTVTLR